MDQSHPSVSLQKKDIIFGLIAGTLVGLLFLPVLNAAKPDLYPHVKLYILPFFLVAIPVGLKIAEQLSRFLPVIWQLAKFVVTGGLNLMVDLGILTLLIALFRTQLGTTPGLVLFSIGLPLTAYTFYKGLSFIIANINSFLWNKYWTFEQKETAESNTKQFGSFLTVSVIGLVINAVTASYVFKAVPPLAGMTLDQWSLIGAVFGSIAGLAWNFIGYKFLVFKK